jgi:hypothetical protein
MRIARFRRLLDAHGADLSRWPPLSVEPARRLIAIDPAAGGGGGQRPRPGRRGGGVWL